MVCAVWQVWAAVEGFHRVLSWIHAPWSPREFRYLESMTVKFSGSALAWHGSAPTQGCQACHWRQPTGDTEDRSSYMCALGYAVLHPLRQAALTTRRRPA